VHTRPTAAYYAFLLATILSLLLGNVASFYHRSVAEGAKGRAASQEAAAEGRVALGRVGRPLAAHLAVAAVLLLAVAVTVAGAVVTSFQFGMSGLGAGLILQESRHTEDFSLVGVGAAVPASMPGDAGLVALQAVFLIIGFAVPVLLLLALALLWLTPLREQQQRTLLYVCHVLDSWSTLDVFVLTVLVGHAEFGQLAGRLLAAGNLKGVCVPLKEQLGLSCMDLDLGLLPGFALLAAAGLVALAVPKSVHQLCRRSVEAREAREVAAGKARTVVAGSNVAGGSPALGHPAAVLPSEARSTDGGSFSAGGSHHASLESPAFGTAAFVPRASG